MNVHFILFCEKKTSRSVANSVDPNQKLHSTVSDLGFHFLDTVCLNA